MSSKYCLTDCFISSGTSSLSMNELIWCSKSRFLTVPCLEEEPVPESASSMELWDGPMPFCPLSLEYC